MGLCKECRKVTSLFCYKHRVNVCEKCMVEKHPTCVVQTYLQWLQDCDFDPTCRVCGDNVENGMETIRLPCLHLLHLGCLDKYAKSFPSNTAPAGFTCPICTTSVVPARNQAGPVADTARAQLSRLSWSRIQLCPVASASESSDIVSKVSAALDGTKSGSPGGPSQDMTGMSPARLDVADAHSTTIESGNEALARRSTTTGDGAAPDVVVEMGDLDDDKYARRPVNTRIARIVSNQLEQAGHFAKSHLASETDVPAGLKKTGILLLIAIMIVVFMLEFWTRTKSAGEDE